MNFTCIFFGAAFIIVGFWFGFMKGYEHLPAWKEMPEDEKEKINITPLCRNIGEVIMLSGIIFLLKGLWFFFAEHYFMTAIIAWLIIAGIDVYYISKSSKYIKK